MAAQEQTHEAGKICSSFTGASGEANWIDIVGPWTERWKN